MSDKQPNEKNPLRRRCQRNGSIFGGEMVHALVILGIVLTVTVASCMERPATTLPPTVTLKAAMPSPMISPTLPAPSVKPSSATPAEVAGGATDLFTDSATEGDLDRSDDPTIVRTRFVNINFDLLAGADGPPEVRPDSANVLALNLFEDVFFTAVLDRVEPNLPDGFSWIGYVEGVEHSQVILVVEEDLMAGNITLPEAFYQVRYAGSGVHAIYEIDQSGFPDEEEPPLPVGVPPETLLVKVAVETVEVRLLESFPVQIELVIHGNLPDACDYGLVVSEEREGQVVSVTLEGQRPADVSCPAGVQPVTYTLLLGGSLPLAERGFVPGDYTLTVNDYQTLVKVD